MAPPFAAGLAGAACRAGTPPAPPPWLPGTAGRPCGRWTAGRGHVGSGECCLRLLAPALRSAAQRCHQLAATVRAACSAANHRPHLGGGCIGADQQVDHFLYAPRVALRRQLLHQLLHLQRRQLALLIELHRRGMGAPRFDPAGGGGGGGWRRRRAAQVPSAHPWLHSDRWDPLCHPITAAVASLRGPRLLPPRQGVLWEVLQRDDQLCCDPAQSQGLSDRTLSAMFLVTYRGSVWLAILATKTRHNPFW